MNFKLRCNDMEVRSCNEHLLSDGEHTTAEIIYWFDRSDKPSCYAIAYWIRGDEGYYLKFVGDRPLQHFEHWSDFGDLVKCGQQELDKYFNTIEFKNGSSITRISTSKNTSSRRGNWQNLEREIEFHEANIENNLKGNYGQVCCSIQDSITALNNLIGKKDYIKTNAIGCDMNEDNRFRGVK